MRDSRKQDVGVVIVRLSKNDAWVNHEQASARGAAFGPDGLLRAKQLAAAANHASTSFDGFVSFIRQLNGSFAIIVRRSKSRCWVAVDHVRTIPLFIGNVDQDMIVSADWDGARPESRAASPSESATVGFLLCGYVTGPDTMDPLVSQVPAGHVADVDVRRGVQRHRYVEFRPSLEASVPPTRAEREERLREVIRGSVDRLIRYADGRQIVVPLSGGLDSRLILAMLRRAGIANTLGFTYGTQSSAEATVSCRVARALATPWHFVRYSPEMWSQWINSTGTDALLSHMHQGVSLPHVQDAIAVQHLIKTGIIQQNAVMAPGHSGDFIAGSHILRPLLGTKQTSSTALLRLLLNRHAKLWPHERCSDAAWSAFCDRLREQVAWNDEITEIQAIANHDDWDLRERQAKFIVNSVRAYEYYGLDWWLPLFDRSFVDLWAQIPCAERIDTALYTRVAVSEYAQVAAEPLRLARSTERSGLIGQVRGFLLKRPALRSVSRRLYDPWKRRRLYDEHPLRWFGAFDRQYFAARFAGRETFWSFLADHVLASNYAGSLRAVERINLLRE